MKLEFDAVKPINMNEKLWHNGILTRILPPIFPKTVGRRSLRNRKYAVDVLQLPIRRSRLLSVYRKTCWTHFKADGRGWQTRIDEALRDWIGKAWRDDDQLCY